MDLTTKHYLCRQGALLPSSCQSPVSCQLWRSAHTIAWSRIVQVSLWRCARSSLIFYCWVSLGRTSFILFSYNQLLTGIGPNGIRLALMLTLFPLFFGRSHHFWWHIVPLVWLATLQIQLVVCFGHSKPYPSFSEVDDLISVVGKVGFSRRGYRGKKHRETHLNNKWIIK